MAKNHLCNKKAGKTLAVMLAGNTTLKELDVSDNQGFGARDGPGFAQKLADGVKNNRALALLDMSNTRIPSDQQANLRGICTSKSIDLAL